MPTSTVKVCSKCGMDLNGQKRVKDAAGSYFCQSCWMEGHADVVAQTGSIMVNNLVSGTPQRTALQAIRWTILGCDRETGEDIHLTIDATSADEASGKAAQKGSY